MRRIDATSSSSSSSSSSNPVIVAYSRRVLKIRGIVCRESWLPHTSVSACARAVDCRRSHLRRNLPETYEIVTERARRNVEERKRLDEAMWYEIASPNALERAVFRGEERCVALPPPSSSNEIEMEYGDDDDEDDDDEKEEMVNALDKNLDVVALRPGEWILKSYTAFMTTTMTKEGGEGGGLEFSYPILLAILEYLAMRRLVVTSEGRVLQWNSEEERFRDVSHDLPPPSPFSRISVYHRPPQGPMSSDQDLMSRNFPSTARTGWKLPRYHGRIAQTREECERSHDVKFTTTVVVGTSMNRDVEGGRLNEFSVNLTQLLTDSSRREHYLLPTTVSRGFRVEPSNPQFGSPVLRWTPPFDLRTIVIATMYVPFLRRFAKAGVPWEELRPVYVEEDADVMVTESTGRRRLREPRLASRAFSSPPTVNTMRLLTDVEMKACVNPDLIGYDGSIVCRTLPDLRIWNQRCLPPEAMRSAEAFSECVDAFMRFDGPMYNTVRWLGISRTQWKQFYRYECFGGDVEEEDDDDDDDDGNDTMTTTVLSRYTIPNFEKELEWIYAAAGRVSRSVVGLDALARENATRFQKKMKRARANVFQRRIVPSNVEKVLDSAVERVEAASKYGDVDEDSDTEEIVDPVLDMKTGTIVDYQRRSNPIAFQTMEVETENETKRRRRMDTTGEIEMEGDDVENDKNLASIRANEAAEKKLDVERRARMELGLRPDPSASEIHRWDSESRKLDSHKMRTALDPETMDECDDFRTRQADFQDGGHNVRDDDGVDEATADYYRRMLFEGSGGGNDDDDDL